MSAYVIVNSVFFPLIQYNAMHRSSMEFHSFEDSWKPGRFSSVGANPLLTAASPPSSSDVSSNTDLPNIRGRGEINSMAFWNKTVTSSSSPDFSEKL